MFRHMPRSAVLGLLALAAGCHRSDPVATAPTTPTAGVVAAARPEASPDPRVTSASPFHNVRRASGTSATTPARRATRPT